MTDDVSTDEQDDEPVRDDAIRFGGTVVAGPPDDSHHLAMLELAAALNGEPGAF